MCMDTDLSIGIQHGTILPHALTDPIHRQSTARVGHVHTVCTVGLHQLRLLGQLRGLGEVRHHEETGHIHAELARSADVLSCDVSLRAVSGDTHRGDAERECVLEFGDRTDTGQQQRGELGAMNHRRRSLDPFPVGIAPRPVGKAVSG